MAKPKTPLQIYLVGLGTQAHGGWPNEITPDWTKSMEAFLQWMSDVDLTLDNALIQFNLWTAHEGDWMHRQLQELSRRIPVAYEILRENKYIYEVSYRGVPIFAASQKFYTSKEMSKKHEKWPEFVAYANQIEDRIWTHPTTGHRLMTIICGERNIVWAARKGVPALREIFSDKRKIFNGVDAILNPTHTYMPLNANHTQARVLSEESNYLLTCNGMFFQRAYGNRGRTKDDWRQNINYRKGEKLTEKEDYLAFENQYYYVRMVDVS